MINTSDFAIRLQKIIDFYDESASSFAEKIGVQRSSISHILSGRNKPSLDFVLKILNAYPEVELYWLLNGKGQFLGEVNKTPIRETPTPDNKEKSILKPESSNNTEIEQIIIFYKDGSFKHYKP